MLEISHPYIYTAFIQHLQICKRFRFSLNRQKQKFEVHARKSVVFVGLNKIWNLHRLLHCSLILSYFINDAVAIRVHVFFFFLLEISKRWISYWRRKSRWDYEWDAQSGVIYGRHERFLAFDPKAETHSGGDLPTSSNCRDFGHRCISYVSLVYSLV